MKHEMKELSVNPETMCFEYMSPKEFHDIKELARELCVASSIDWENPYVKMWLTACNVDESKRLLIGSTVMPLRFFLSVTGGYPE